MDTNTGIESLSLSNRARNALKRAGINTVGDLLSFNRSTLLELPAVGANTAREIIDIINILEMDGKDAGTGDPSSFDFAMDAFPGYTYFDKSKKVLCVLQIAGDVANAEAASTENPVMPHNNIIEHADPLNNDSAAGNDSGE